MISSITLRHIQAIEDEMTFEFDANGLVRFRGENSNGKSILVKAVVLIIKDQIHILAERKPLVNYSYTEGQVIIRRRDGIELLANIAIEAKSTYYELTEPNKQPIRRYLADKDLYTLVQKLGFHYDKTRDISLNIYETYDPLLFVTTSSVVNYDVLNSAITDPIAEKILTDSSEQLKEIEVKYKEESDRKTLALYSLNQLPTCDVEYEKKKIEELEYLYSTIKNLSVPELPILTPQINFKNLKALSNIYVVCESLNDLVVPNNEISDILNSLKILASVPKMRDLTYEMSQIIELVDAIENEVCPLCKRGFKVE